ncbi:MAG: hypothetical protein OEY14_09620 [Myxococcales bacterium]|nr:hypothetical protein [Myxococcales bacterium]
MNLRPSARYLVRLGALVLIFAIFVGVWELVAAQAPYTPLDFGLLEAPARQLRQHALAIGLLLLLGAWLLPWVAPEREPKVLLGLITLGTLLSLGAMTWAAAAGMMAIQIFDPRGDARLLAYLRLIGQGILALAALEYLRRLLRAGRAPGGARGEPR